MGANKDNWHIEKAMANVMRSRQDKLKPNFQRASVTVDDDTLSHCLITVAHIVKEHGGTYLPIFERLKHELDEYRRSQNIKDFALDMAEQHPKTASPDKNKQNPSF